MNAYVINGTQEEAQYVRWLEHHPRNNLWQSLAWKKYRESCGKRVNIWVLRDANTILCSALVVIDRTIFGLETWDIPRGPIMYDDNEQWGDMLLDRIMHAARGKRVMNITYSPATALMSQTLKATPSQRHLYPRASRIIDLTKHEDELLAAMHPKGRYNIGVAKRHGVTVRKGSTDDLDAFHKLLIETSARDRFTISQKSSYERFLYSLPSSFILMAYIDGKPIAGLLGVIYGEGAARRGIYYYGASSWNDRQHMAPYALQWAAIQYCKEMGCTSYDLLGESPPDASGDDPWRGITDFKRKFGGTLEEYAEERKIELRPWAIRLLSMKRLLLG